MNWEAIGAISEMIGAVGVILTLVYLAIQIRQNTGVVRTSTFHEAIRDQAKGMDQLNADPELNRIFYDGLDNFDSLTKEEKRRFATYLTSVLRRYESMVYQTESGTLDLEAWSGIREHLKYVLSQPGSIIWWENARNLFNPQLRDFVENQLNK